MYAKGVPVLIRRFSFGLETMQKRIVAQLHIDPITAVAMLSHPGFDLAPILQPVLAPIAKQLAISRGFVERKTGQGIRSIHIGGALAGVAGVRSWLERDVGLSVETWDPLDALSEPAEALPDVLVEAPWRFAAAIGVALGVMHT